MPPFLAHSRRCSRTAAALCLTFIAVNAPSIWAEPLPATEPALSVLPAGSATPAAVPIVPLRPPLPRPTGPMIPIGRPRTPETAVTPNNRNPLRHSEFLDRIKEGPINLLLLGDSITDGWNRRGENSWLKFAPYHPANFGVSGERTEDVLWRINNGELEGFTPKVTVLMIGTNNLGQGGSEKPEWTVAGITKIVQTVREKLPDTTILLLAVFPRDKAVSPVRAQIKEVNDAIAKLDDGKHVRFLDIGHVFLDESGEIPKNVMPDSLHPNPKGYDLWYDAMRPLLDELMK